MGIAWQSMQPSLPGSRDGKCDQGAQFWSLTALSPRLAPALDWR